MKRKYPWKWIQFPHRWWPHVRGGSLHVFGAGYEWRSAPRVPPDTARMALARLEWEAAMDTLADEIAEL